MPRLQATNNAASTLAIGIDADDVTLTVVDGSSFPTSNFRCTLFTIDSADGEIIEVGSRSGNVFSSIIRAQEGTTAAIWSSGTKVELLITAGIYNELVSTEDTRIPSQSENDALAGTSGTPSSTNKYVTNEDSRMTNARTPTAHKSTHASGGSDALSPADIGAAASSHTHSAADITSGTLASARGGTGLASFTSGSYFYASSTSVIAQKTPAEVLSDIGAAASSHTHSAADITSGTLAVARGGTGIASYTTGNYIYASAATTLAQKTPAEVLSHIAAMPLAGGTFSGNVNFSDYLAQRPVIKDYAETVKAHGTTGGSITCNLEDGNIHTITLNAATTFTFSNPPASGKAGSLTLIITQASTAVSVTWPASVDWVYGSAPDLSGDSTDYVLVFLTIDGGTTWRGWLSGSDFS